MTIVRLGIIGCGNMAHAILKSALAQGVLDPSAVTVSDYLPQKAEEMATGFGVTAAASNQDVAKASDIILFAIKPQDAKPIFTELAPLFRTSGKTALSIIAGLPMATMSGWLGTGSAVIRVMPNTPIQVGQGASVITCNPACSREHLAWSTQLFTAGGICLPLDEVHFDAVTALSGSGPAYVFLFMEALAKAAEALGLPGDVTGPLILQTMKGSLTLADQATESLEGLRQKVTSKGGTTEAALTVLAARHFHDILREALEAARNRAMALSQALT